MQESDCQYSVLFLCLPLCKWTRQRIWKPATTTSIHKRWRKIAYKCGKHLQGRWQAEVWSGGKKMRELLAIVKWLLLDGRRRQALNRRLNFTGRMRNFCTYVNIHMYRVTLSLWPPYAIYKLFLGPLWCEYFMSSALSDSFYSYFMINIFEYIHKSIHRTCHVL